MVKLAASHRWATYTRTVADSLASFLGHCHGGRVRGGSSSLVAWEEIVCCPMSESNEANAALKKNTGKQTRRQKYTGDAEAR